MPAMGSIEVVRWWWVRHAPAIDGGVRHAFCGWSDPAADLSDGETLAALRSSLPDEAALVTSDLTRAVETADALARRTWRRWPAEAALREQNFGAWEGRPSVSDAPEIAAFWRDPAFARPPGGESFADLCDRVGRYVAGVSRNVAARGAGAPPSIALVGVRGAAGEEARRADIVAVAHAGAVRAALALALALPPAQALAFEIAPLSLTRIDWIASQGAWRIGAVNFAL